MEISNFLHTLGRCRCAMLVVVGEGREEGEREEGKREEGEWEEGEGGSRRKQRNV